MGNSMDLVLDVNVVLDIAATRNPHVEAAAGAIAKARHEGCRIWLYTGSVQTLHCRLTDELRHKRPELATADASQQAKDALRAFAAHCHWLAGLACDGPEIFEEEDPADAQLLRAVQRLGNNARLLTRNPRLLESAAQITISPERFLQAPPTTSPLAFIDLAAQQDRLRSGLERRLHTVLHHGRYIMGPEVTRLEAELASFVGSRHCVGCSSGTDALLLPLMAWGIGRGDAVFTTPFTFIATAEAIALCGATPVFVDIDPRTYNLDPSRLAAAIERVTRSGKLVPRCIVPVDLFGLPAHYEAIRAVARQHGLLVLEDAAQAFGAVSGERRAPSFGDVGITSFFPAKPLGCYGDGGAAFTEDDELAERMRSILVHGKGRDKYNSVRIGLNARLDTLQAAVLLEKLRLYTDEIEARQRIARQYAEALSGIPGLQLPYVPSQCTSVWAQYSVQTPDRARIQAALKDAGIPTAIYYVRPLHLLEAFDFLGHRPGDFPVAEAASERIFSLPFHPYLEEGTIARIADTIRGAAPEE